MEAGKTFLEKSFPRPPFKRLLGQGVGGEAAPGFYRCGSWQNGLVRSTFGDPDLRSP